VADQSGLCRRRLDADSGSQHTRWRVNGPQEINVLDAVEKGDYDGLPKSVRRYTIQSVSQLCGLDRDEAGVNRIGQTRCGSHRNAEVAEPPALEPQPVLSNHTRRLVARQHEDRAVTARTCGCFPKVSSRRCAWSNA